MTIFLCACKKRGKNDSETMNQELEAVAIAVWALTCLLFVLVK